MTGARFGGDDEDEDAAATPAQSTPAPSCGGPQLGIRSPVGSGKTESAIEMIQRVCASDPDSVCVVFVPNHALADELAARLGRELGPGVQVAVWRGVDQPDPTTGSKRTMCQRRKDVALANELGGSISDVCGSRKRGFCQHHPDAGGDCAYLAQTRRRANVWVLTHAMLSSPAPASWPRAVDATGGKGKRARIDLVIIDECFWPAMLRGGGPKPYAIEQGRLSETCFDAVPDRGSMSPGLNTRRLRDARERLASALASAPDGESITKGELHHAGLSAPTLRQAHVLALACKTPLPRAALPRAATGTVDALLGGAYQANKTVLAVAQLFKVAADVADGHLGPAALRAGKNKAGARCVFLRWRDDIHADWVSARGVLHMDATMQPRIVRQWLPRLDAPAVPPAPASHMRVVQVWDRVFGYTSVLESRNSSPDGKRAARENAARVGRVCAELASRYAGRGAGAGPDVLIVFPKELEAGLRGALPPNVATAHFGNLRGLDNFKGVAAMLIVSRPLPAPQAVEDEAEIVFGRAVERAKPDSFYPKTPGAIGMADGTARGVRRHYHPDPEAEEIRWARCEAELIQAVGRVRGPLRTAQDPVDVLIVTNVPIEGLQATGVCMLEDVWRELAGDCPVRKMVQAGLVPFDWQGVGEILVACGALPPGTGCANAARCRFDRDHASMAGLRQARIDPGKYANNARFSYINTLGGTNVIRASAGTWPAFRYRRKGQRKTSRVLIDPRHSDPRGVAEAMFGPLASFSEDRASRKAPPARKGRGAGASRPGAPPPIPAAALPGAALAGPGTQPGHDQPGAAPARLAPSDATPAPCAPLPVKPRAAASAPLVLALEPAPAPSAPRVRTLHPGFSGGASLGPPDRGAAQALPIVDDTTAAVQLGLPSVLDVLVARGNLSKAERAETMNRFRRARGTHSERERRTLCEIALRVGPAVLQAAAHAAALEKLRAAHAGGTRPRREKDRRQSN